jgi:uncharacterized protein YndB with AHSA1/START domain
MNNNPIIVERTYDAPVDRVWKAITDKEEMKKWYFDLPQFLPVAGNEFTFEGGTPEKTYLHLAKVTEVIPNQKLQYSWRYDGYPGNSFVTFDLIPNGEKTTVRLTHEGLETFPSDNPDFAKENFVEGWNAIIGTNLKEYLAGLT